MPELLNSRNGNKMEFLTTVLIGETQDEYVFSFQAENSLFYCPFQNYNEDHWLGDVCEIFIGDNRTPTDYYEIEVSPKGGLFFARIFNPGDPDLIEVELLENNMISASAEMLGTGYKAEIRINKSQLNIPVENIVFNAFRIDTDGGEVANKHLIALSPTMYDDQFHVPSVFLPLKKFL